MFSREVIMWVKENRSSMTTLDSLGIYVTLMPNAVIQIGDSPQLQKAIEIGLVIEVEPIWNERGKCITGYTEVE